MFWYYMIPGCFIAYFILLGVLITTFKRLGMYDSFDELQ